MNLEIMESYSIIIFLPSLLTAWASENSNENTISPPLPHLSNHTLYNLNSFLIDSPNLLIASSIFSAGAAAYVALKNKSSCFSSTFA